MNSTTPTKRKRRKRKPTEFIGLLRVKSASERSVCRRLRESGIRGYSPAFLDRRPSGPVEVILFPGYVFVWPDHRWREISRTKGVYEFVRFGDIPAQVPEAVITELKALEGPTGYVRLLPPFTVGQHVRIGSDTGPQVTVKALLSLDRVRVLLSILGRAVEMVVPSRDLVAA